MTLLDDQSTGRRGSVAHEVGAGRPGGAAGGWVFAHARPERETEHPGMCSGGGLRLSGEKIDRRMPRAAEKSLHRSGIAAGPSDGIERPERQVEKLEPGRAKLRL